jgi:hypothetical protein
MASTTRKPPERRVFLSQAAARRNHWSSAIAVGSLPTTNQHVACGIVKRLPKNL